MNAPTPLPFYRAFEDRHRGARALIKTRLQVYLPFIRPLQNLYGQCAAVDVGCGRGEWLELLLRHGFTPQGVDLDEGMLAICHELELPAFYGDAIAYLQQLDDASLTVVSGFHIAEHIPFESLQQLVAEAHRVLKPAGLLILETPNAENITVGTHSFYMDPTHEKPLPQELLVFLTNYVGFERQKILRLQENPELHASQTAISLMSVLEGVSPDYAVVAQKAAPVRQTVLFDAAFEKEYGLSLRQLVGRYQDQLDRQEASHDQQLHQLSAQYAELQTQVERSASWQVRRLGRGAYQRLRAMEFHPKDLVRWPLRKSLAWVMARPKVRHQLARSLQHIPWLYQRLLRFAHHYSHAAQHAQYRTPPAWFQAELPLTPYVQQLAGQLQQRLAAPAPAAVPDSATDKPKLAFVSPLPKQRTGIADYSAELLPVLADYYDITVITEQSEVEEAWITAHCAIHDAAWLRAHAHHFERVLYQVGNSHFHAYMLSLMQEVPGLVVLHDFYLSGLFSYAEAYGEDSYAWSDALYQSHGYLAVQRRFADSEAAKQEYPVNFSVLAAAQGVIVHSEYSHQLAKQWYGSHAKDHWTVIPHLRVPAEPDVSQTVARQHVGIEADRFVICSFGFLNPSKLNHRLLNVWLQSALAKDPRCLLVFVGENYQGEYGVELQRTIKAHGLQERVLITGFMEAEEFKHYLAAADMAVQLRTHSRGESSGTVLDCMNYGLPLIINANGSMAEIDAEAVCMLPDDFEDAALQQALENFWQDADQRQQLGERAKASILAHYAPKACAKLYADAIEQAWQRAEPTLPQLRQEAAAQLPAEAPMADCLAAAQRLADKHPAPRAAKRLFLDLTATCHLDLKTGIERVARAIALALLAAPPVGFRIEIVYLTQKQGQWVYQHAHQYTLTLLDSPSVLYDSVVDFQAGDVVLGLDLSSQKLIQAQQAGLFSRLQELGVTVHCMVHDILPIRMPEVFPPSADELHAQWARAVASFDGIVGVSKTVANDFAAWMSENNLSTNHFLIDYSHHGADVTSSAPSTGMPANAEAVFQQLAQRPTFLMVGTIEPRKGYLQVINAFTELWAEGVEINLVIVGNEGWQGLAKAARRDIPQTVETLRQHPELGKRLFWLEGISDEYLENVYAASTCLITASKGEGFGLPLIEAAQHQLPILARDIPVFREVAGEHAFYFTGTAPTDLATAVKDWLVAYNSDQHPQSATMPWLTWAQSAEQLTIKLVGQ